MKKIRRRSTLKVLDLDLDMPSQVEGDHLPLLTEIRAGEADIVDEASGLSISFGIQQAYLQLVLKGCNITIGHRDGDVITEEGDIETSKVREHRRSESSGSLSGSSSITPKSITANLGAAGKIEATKTREEESETERRKIIRRRTALSRERWRYNVIDEDYLQGLIQSANDSVCGITISASDFSITGIVGFWATGKNVVLLDVSRNGYDVDVGQKLLRLVSSRDNAKKKAIELIIAKGLRSSGAYVEVERCSLESKKDNEFDDTGNG